MLKVLSKEAMHGYGIARRVQQLSEDLLRLEEGSLYPALYRLEKKGWICSAWKKAESGRRARFYSLTELGSERLVAEERNWSALSGAIERILRLA